METADYFLRCRESVFNKECNSFLLSKIENSDQEKDLTVSPNCNGYGRIRHFRRFISEGWGKDPLPIDPACKLLQLEPCDMIETEVFQIASCNVKCWYCFVPENLKRASECNSKWFTASDMLDMFQRDCEGVRVLDLSGGNPELVPEWTYYVMKELEKRQLDSTIYLWSDDTLTTNYFFEFLNEYQIEYIRNYKFYGKVCCFKGFDNHSFSFNTKLPSVYFDKQFENFEKYFALGLDIYGYVTFTTDDINELEEKMTKFIARLRKIHPLLPLRIIPLKITVFTPVHNRINLAYIKAIENQNIVYREWKKQLEDMYEENILNTKICDISLL